MTAVFLFPNNILKHWKKWGNFFDAIGLAAFAVQGGFFAAKNGTSVKRSHCRAVLTGSGGGMIRDVLAGRKPTVLKEEIYAVWAIIAGAAVGLGIAKSPFELYTLCLIIVVLRMCTYMYNWSLPIKSLNVHKRNTTL